MPGTRFYHRDPEAPRPGFLTDELGDLDIVATCRDVLETYLTREAPVLD
jgi:hypothetical protein